MAMVTTAIVAAATPSPAAMMSSLPPPTRRSSSSAAGGSSPNPNSSPRSDDDDGQLGASSLSLALRGSDSSGSDFVVGSLPMHLRRGPAPPSFSTMHALPSKRRTDAPFLNPASLPTHLRAPFLSSREGPAHNLLSMPEFQLPESVASVNRTLSSSVQYGSLRESRYHRGLCDNFRSRKMNGAGMKTSDSLQPLGSLSATDRRTEIHLNSNLSSPSGASDNLSSSLGGSGIGLLSHRVEGNMLPIRTDVEGITRGCHGIRLCEANGPLSCTTRGDGVSRRGGDRSNFDNEAMDSTPLSSSLTALDILTQIRGPQRMVSDAGANAEGARAEGTHVVGVPRGGVITAQENGSHRLKGGFAPQQCPVTGMSSEDDEEDDDDSANPDTFEAFDLELEG